MSTNFKPESLRLHIRAAAQTRIGKRRTDSNDIARILIEHGAHSTAAENEVINAISTAIPAAKYDRERVRQLNTKLDEHAASGYSLAELQRARKWGRDRRGGRWEEIKRIDAEIAGLHADVNRRSEAVDAAVESWWRENDGEIKRIAMEEAQEFLRSRQRGINEGLG